MTLPSAAAALLALGVVGCRAEEHCGCAPPMSRVTVTSSTSEMLDLSVSGTASRWAVVTCLRAGVPTGCHEYEVFVIESGTLHLGVLLSDGSRRARDLSFVLQQEDACCSALVRVGPSQGPIDVALPDPAAG